MKCNVCGYKLQKHIKEVGGFIPCEYCFLRKENERLLDIVNQVDDVLVTNWVSVKNNDWIKALHDLVMFNIDIHEYFKTHPQPEVEIDF